MEALVCANCAYKLLRLAQMGLVGCTHSIRNSGMRHPIFLIQRDSSCLIPYWVAAHSAAMHVPQFPDRNPNGFVPWLMGGGGGGT